MHAGAEGREDADAEVAHLAHPVHLRQPPRDEDGRSLRVPFRHLGHLRRAQCNVPGARVSHRGGATVAPVVAPAIE